MMTEGVTPEIVAQRIRDARGNLSLVADQLRVSRASLYKYINKYESLKGVVAEARERMLDHAESVLYQKVLEGDMTALIFFLKTQGYMRGYKERHEVSGPDNGPMIIKVVYDEKPGSALTTTA
jgi:hypothetical protein